MRGVFASGVLDHFLAQNFNPFDFYLGVSAGASNLAGYLADMPGRTLKVYTDYCIQPRFIDFKRFAKGGHLMDLDWLWQVTIAEIRLNLARIHERNPFYIVTTNVEAGCAEYHQTAADTLEDLLFASSSMPIFYRDFPVIDGAPRSDGGIADALPVAEAIRRGATDIMVIRSRPRSYIKKKDWSSRPVAWKFRRFPKLKPLLLSRTERYNRSLDLLRSPPPGVNILEICPPENFSPSRLGREREVLLHGYEQGRAAGARALADWLR